MENDIERGRVGGSGIRTSGSEQGQVAGFVNLVMNLRVQKPLIVPGWVFKFQRVTYEKHEYYWKKTTENCGKKQHFVEN